MAEGQVVPSAIAGRPLAAASGGTVTEITVGADTYRVHTFTSTITTTFNVATPIEVEYLVIAGGGGSLREAGGGAGGYRSSVSGESSGGGAGAESPISLNPGSYTVSVGAGGLKDKDGEDSVFHTITSIGGGRGAQPGDDGGSGGGGGRSSAFQFTTGGSGTANQGFDGGIGDDTNNPGAGGGGGGGAGQAGTDAGGDNGGNGGDGVSSAIDGRNIFRAGGGAGGGGFKPGAPGLGGGGSGNIDGNGLMVLQIPVVEPVAALHRAAPAQVVARA